MLSRSSVKWQCLAMAIVVVAMLAGQLQASTLYQNAVLADAPCYYWTWDETSGNALNDGSGGGGALVGSTNAARAASTVNAGGLSLGKGASFTGGSDEGWWAVTAWGGADLGDSHDYSSYAIEFWAKLPSSDAMYLSDCWRVGESTNEPAVVSGYTDSHLELYRSAARTGAAFPTIADNAWHHVVIGLDGSIGTATMIVDGDYAGRATAAMNGLLSAHGGRLSIGRSMTDTDNLVGMIDEYAIYDMSGMNSSQYDVKLQHLADHYSVAAPEPGAAILLGIALIGLLVYAWRKRR
jgi:hypothetical protein